MKVVKKRGQVWVETVIYTLIALALIGTVLAFVKPKIEEIQDKITVDQTIELMSALDSRILSVSQGGVGNQRLAEIQIKDGVLKIDGDKNEIVFTLPESRHAYSEPSTDAESNIIKSGNVNIQTIKRGTLYEIILNISYAYDLTVNGENESISLSKAPTPYRISISNNGGNVIDLRSVN